MVGVKKVKKKGLKKKTKPKKAAPAKSKKKVWAASILDRIQVVTEDTTGIVMSIYGRSGTGKTTLWGTFPQPILGLICSGMGELKSLPKVEGIHTAPVISSEDIAEVVEMQKQTQKYATIVLDHATGFQDRLLAEILGLDKVPEQKSWGMATREQYGQCALQFKTLLRPLIDLAENGTHIVVVAQEKTSDARDDTDVIQPTVGSALTGSAAGWLNTMCDYIVQTYLREKTTKKTVTIGGESTDVHTPTGEVEYCLRTAAHPVYTARFRKEKGTKLPECIVDPTFEKIWELIG